MSENIILKNKAIDGKKTIKKENKTDIKTNIKNKLDEKDKKGDIATKTTLNKLMMKNKLDTNNSANEEINSCSFCGSSDIFTDYSKHEIVCNTCGMVLEENLIDSTPSGTAVGKDGRNMSHHGGSGSIAVHENLATEFKLDNVPKQNMPRWRRLKRLHNQSRVRGSRERNLSRAFNELKTLVSQLSLSTTVKNEAASIYKKAVDKDLVRGRSISLLLAASVYAACRVCRVPRTLDEIAEVTPFSKKRLGKNYRFLSSQLGLIVPRASPRDYIPKFTSNLGLSSRVEVKSIEIIDEAQELGLIGSNHPSGVAAAALYCSCLLLGERRTQNEIAKATNVTAVTLRNRYKEMAKKMDLFN